MNGKFSLKEFFSRFPDDTACLEEIRNIRWPNGEMFDVLLRQIAKVKVITS